MPVLSCLFDALPVLENGFQASSLSPNPFSSLFLLIFEGSNWGSSIFLLWYPPLPDWTQCPICRPCLITSRCVPQIYFHACPLPWKRKVLKDTDLSYLILYLLPFVWCPTYNRCPIKMSLVIYISFNLNSENIGKFLLVHVVCGVENHGTLWFFT